MADLNYRTRLFTINLVINDLDVEVPKSRPDFEWTAVPEMADSPMFIGGARRSGTSLVRTILNAHPGIAVGPELKIVPRIMKLWTEIQRDPYLTDEFGFEDAEINDAFAELIRSLIAPTRRRSGAPRLEEKTPNNVFFFRYLHQVFPDSSLVQVVWDCQGDRRRNTPRARLR